VYIKLYKDRQSESSYLIQHILEDDPKILGQLRIQTQDKDFIYVSEDELFAVIDSYFKGIQNEKESRNDKKRRYEARQEAYRQDD